MTLIQHHSFFDPPLIKVIEGIQGGTLGALPDIPLKIKWPADFHDKLRDFLKKGDLTSLSEFLSVYPMAIAHPVIFGEIQHLAKMVRLQDTKGVQELQIKFGLTPDESETILSPSDKATAKALLESILDTAVSHLLPGYMVTKRPQTKTLGRKPKHDPPSIIECFLDFQSHCESLAKIFSNHARSIKTRKKTFWKPQKGETTEKFHSRMESILHELNEESFLSMYRAVGPLKKGSPSLSKPAQSISPEKLSAKSSLTKKDLDEFYPMNTIVKHYPLPPTTITAIIEYAIRSKHTVDPRWLVYAFLAHWQHQTPDAIRGVIERYETDHPDEAFNLNAVLYRSSH